MGKQNFMLLCYWGIDSELTQSTIWPRLEMLEHMGIAEKIILVTMERAGFTKTKTRVLNFDTVTHLPLLVADKGWNMATKVADFSLLPRKLSALCTQEKIHVLLAHGAMAGALAYKVWRILKIPFYVSSFEPHAAYMLDSVVWSKHSLKYRFQQYWENQQKKYAAGLMPVADSFKTRLLSEGVSAARAVVVPCSVNVARFRYKAGSRTSLRQHLGWQHATIGLYAGKYGDLYYKEEAFYIYKRCFEHFPNFRLIILSPQPKEEIEACLRQFQIDEAKVYINSVPHTEVPAYLSAADFAFATIKSYPSARYCSPVKVGEYWASGLPVLLTEGVGDDSDIIQREGGGATFNLRQEGSLEQALRQIQQILKDPNHRQEIPKLAQRYRSPERIREAYEHFFGQKTEGQR